MSQNVEAHILKRYKLLKKVGSGAYGHVWKVNQIKTGKVLALKKIFDAFQHSTDAQRTYREITLLHQINNQNIIKLHKVIKAENDKDLYLVFEFMEADLHNAISQKILKDLHNRYIIYQLMKGIKYLHDSNIIHRDLKPSNLLINSDCSLKICDLGLARTITSKNPDEDTIFTEEVATRWYRAPEVLLGSQSYDQSADIWSIGCILAEMLIGKPFFPGNSTLNQLQKIVTFLGMPSKSDLNSIQSPLAENMLQSLGKVSQKHVKDWFKPQVSQQAIDLVLKTVRFNPKKRLTAQQILRHPYLQQFSQIYIAEKNNKIYADIPENSKKSVKQYKKLIYEWIYQTYQDQSENLFSKNHLSRQNNRIPLKQSSNNQIKKSHSAKHTSYSVKQSPLYKKKLCQTPIASKISTIKKLYRCNSQKSNKLYNDFMSPSSENIYKDFKALKDSLKNVKKSSSLLSTLKDKHEKTYPHSTLNKYFKATSHTSYSSKYKEGRLNM